jgi:hypothetical protein
MRRNGLPCHPRQFPPSLSRRPAADLALDVLVQVAKAQIKGCTPRDRVAAANAILDRGFGRPTQQIDMMMLTKRLNELSLDELVALNSKLPAM